jgi:2-amino-4-hydroxy-6-hydroxymethyldihydropteridine diphosphokinase
MLLLGLGSNLSSSFGDRFKNIDLAISYLELYEIKVVKKSSFYESLSYPNKENPKFINIVVQASTYLEPVDIASALIFIEEKLERKRKYKNDPRTCDIDIIDFNSQIFDFKYKNLDFTVPHKKLSYRNFVLIPLKEILPNWTHPKTKDSIDKLLDQLPIEDKNSILKIIKS